MPVITEYMFLQHAKLPVKENTEETCERGRTSLPDDEQIISCPQNIVNYLFIFSAQSRILQIVFVKHKQKGCRTAALKTFYFEREGNRFLHIQ